jgi:formate/nitrite transporter FocA (FNT family)
MTANRAALFPGKYFISTILDALETKDHMSGRMGRRYLQRAGMAGIIIGLMYLVNYTVISVFAGIPVGTGNLGGVGKIVGALAFGWALVFIYYTKSELLTSNMMIVSIGMYYRRVGIARSGRLLGLCFAGNVLGGLLMAALIKFSSLADGAVLASMDAAVTHKLDYITSGPGGWLDLLVRAILCNFMINLAMLLVYNGLIKDDLTKSLVMIMSVFIFAFLGFEHSVANTVLFTIMGLKHGIDIGAAALQVAICLVGNYIGGGWLIGLYYAYVNDDRRFPDEEASA